MDDATYDAVIRQAEDIGREHGTNAASWVFDGNTTAETYRWYLAGIESGDPEVYDSLREPNLSGEFADDWTDRDLARELGIEPDEIYEDDLALDDFAERYLTSASAAFWHEVERIARVNLA